MLKLVSSFLTGACLIALAATAPSIGIVKSAGEFRVNGSAVPGNTTLFEGDLVETSTARSIVQVDAAQFTLLPASRAHIYHDRALLEQGSGLLAGARLQTVEAGTLRIVSASKSSVIQVEIVAPGHVSVAAREGAAEVRNSSGVLVASLGPGMALAFEPQAGASTAVQMTGKLESRNGRFFLTDTTTRVTVELQGTDLAKYVGVEVEITGSTIPGAAVSNVSPVVQVVTIKPVTHTKRAAAGLSRAATGAIIGGVAVVGTVVGLAAAGTFNGNAASRQ